MDTSVEQIGRQFRRIVTLVEYMDEQHELHVSDSELGALVLELIEMSMDAVIEGHLEGPDSPGARGKLLGFSDQEMDHAGMTVDDVAEILKDKSFPSRQK